ncbi:MAG: GNAT family N-acetyltransferase [Sphaerobacter sp.]|nr:GNAT family N-acetyltransferase [Sphaerobacter sp.]
MAGRAIEVLRSIDTGTARLEIRWAALRDLAALHTLQRRCFAEGQAYGLATLFALYLWPRAAILVAWAAGRVAGCVVGDRNGDRARILNLCVDPDFRRRGIGALLLQTAEEVLGARDITLMVEDKNAGAQELYRRAGYIPIADLRNYYGKNRHGILMQKRR